MCNLFGGSSCTWVLILVIIFLLGQDNDSCDCIRGDRDDRYDCDRGDRGDRDDRYDCCCGR